MPVIKLCDYVQPIPDDPSKDFLYCTLTNQDSTWDQIIPISDIQVTPQEPKDKVVCTTLNNLTALRVFAQNTQNWINNNCQGN